MAKYTIELRTVCSLVGKDKVESWFSDYDLNDFLNQDQQKTISDVNIWNKEKLAKMLVNHYYMREIGFETIELFRIQLKNRLYEIMGKYLPIIYSNSIEFDPLVNVDYTETYHGTDDRLNKGTISNQSNSNTNGTNNSHASGLTVNSDTPQGQINKDDILSGKYASSTSAGDSINENNTETQNASTSIQTNNLSDNNIQEYTRNKKGNDGITASAQKLLDDYRKTIYNVNQEIIKDLDILFMGVF